MGALTCLINWNVQSNEAVMQDLNMPSISRKERERNLLEQMLLADESLDNHEDFARTMLAIKEAIIENSVESEEVLSLLDEADKKSVSFQKLNNDVLV